ncbi:MAG: porin family protein [Prevotellaceae bacterium]|jgi:outer membrane protein X|nr:porin family protein [Prevotellaceae bacterium]
MKVLKKAAIMLVVATAFAMNVSAQEQGDMALGVNLALGSGDGVTNYGIGAKFQYSITDPIRLEGAFTYFLPKTYGKGIVESKLNMWDISVNGQYLFSLNETLTVYPLAGLGVLGTSYKSDVINSASVSSTDFGLNVGGGIDFKLTEKLVLCGQVKYMIAGDWSRPIATAGVTYKFN